MRAILKKTVSPNFKAGDVLIGENYRIKKLVQKNVAVKDSSLLSMWGAYIGAVTGALLLGFLIFLMIPISAQWIYFQIPLAWNVTLLIVGALNITINLAYAFNIKAPYFTTFMTMLINPIAAMMILIGHEQTVRSYNAKSMSIFAGTTMAILGTSTIVVAVLALLDLNFILFPDVPGFANQFMYPVYMSLIVGGAVAGIAFDINFTNTRKRFISFLVKENASIEYKVKAINAMKAYKNTGNADKFIEENLDILENTLNDQTFTVKNT